MSGQVGSPVQFNPRVERWHWVSGRQLQRGGQRSPGARFLAEQREPCTDFKGAEGSRLYV